jgi:hypothetical protein
MVMVTLLPLLMVQVGELDAEEESSPHAVKRTLAPITAARNIFFIVILLGILDTSNIYHETRAGAIFLVAKCESDLIHGILMRVLAYGGMFRYHDGAIF